MGILKVRVELYFSRLILERPQSSFFHELLPNPVVSKTRLNPKSMDLEDIAMLFKHDASCKFILNHPIDPMGLKIFRNTRQCAAFFAEPTKDLLVPLRGTAGGCKGKLAGYHIFSRIIHMIVPFLIILISLNPAFS